MPGANFWLATEAVPAWALGRIWSGTFEWPPNLVLAAAVALYLAGVYRIRRRHPGESWPVWRTVAFLAGAVAVVVAIDSVLGVYDDVLFADHLAQHLVLIMVAAPLFAMGAPVELARKATSGPAHSLLTNALRSRTAEVVGHPIFGFLLYAVMIPVAHLTSLYDVTIINTPVHELEHGVFLLIGYLFWRPVVGIEPSRHPMSPGLRLLYLMLALPVDTFTGLALSSATHELFSAYRSIHRTWGPSRLDDLHLGGDFMWIGGDVLMLVAMIPVGLQWRRSNRPSR